MEKEFYIYEWYNKDTKEIFYVGKGCGKRVRQIKGRNKLFLDYISKNNVDYRIIKYFTSEQDAFVFENNRIKQLKEHGECSCNLDNGGTGGVQFSWTEEMRKYKSIYNPMKTQEQRARMSSKNPMKNPETAKKVSKTKQKRVIIKGVEFESVKMAGKFYNVPDVEISHWCKRGYDRDKEPCRYANEEQKAFTLKVTNSKKVFVDNIVFCSVKEAAKHLQVWPETIIRCIKNNKKCKNHHVRYGNQQPSIDLNDL